MIRHVALAKFKEFAEGCTRKELMEKARILTEALPGKIPYIKRVEVSCNILYEGPFSYDTVTYSEFEDMESVQKTLAHPVHIELNNFMARVLESGCSVTY